MLEFPLVLVEELLRGVVDVTVQELEAHPEREESLLCAVVEVALESPPLLVAGLDDPRARLPQLDQLGAQLRLQALVFQCKSCCRADRLQQPRLVEQITVVDQHRETIAEIGDPTRAIGRHGEFATLLVHPDTTLRQPQPKDKRRVTQRARERITYLARLDLTKLARPDRRQHRERAAPARDQTPRRQPKARKSPTSRSRTSCPKARPGTHGS